MARTMISLALTLCIAAVSASRSPLDLLMTPWTSIAKSNAMHAVDNGKYSKGVYVNYKLFVPPALVSEFADKWDSYIGKPASKAEGNNKIVLSRPAISNAVHFSYSEWETMEDFADFAESKDARDFKAYLADADIKYEIDILVKPRDPERAGAEVAKKHKDKTFSVLTTIILQPHNAEGFKDAFFDAEEETQRENDNDAYSLSRVITTNDKFYVYGAWTSESAWLDHLESKHSQKLVEYFSKHNIIYVVTPLVTLIQY